MAVTAWPKLLLPPTFRFPDGVWTRAHHVPLALLLGESAARLALPWGDSAYTSWVPQRWLPGDPDSGPGWCMGPPANGLTPSSEGPRRRNQAEARAMYAQAQRWAEEYQRKLERAQALWDTPMLPAGDRIGWVDNAGNLRITTRDQPDPDRLPRTLKSIAAVRDMIRRIGL
ncbi:hypothetical protein ACW2Q0_28345 [Nocardia sp. R16R-3T]